MGEHNKIMSETKYLISDFKSSDSKKIYYHGWINSNPRANLAIIHGYAEHGARYEHFARFFANNGFSVFAIDLRGHGISEGIRAHVNSFSEYFDDFNLFIDIIKKKYGRDTIALGHSMGGLILTDYIIRVGVDTSFKASILTSPLFKLKMDVPLWAKPLKILKSIYPTFRVKNEIDPYSLSHDREIVNRYVNDPLVSKTTTVGWYFSLLSKMDEISGKSSKITIPMHIFQGGDDRICDKNGAILFKNSSINSMIEVTVLDNLYHEVLNEVNREETYRAIAKWIDNFIK